MVRQKSLKRGYTIRLRAVSYFSLQKLLHAKPKHASGKAASREKRGHKPEKKKFSRLVSVIHNVVAWNRAG